MGHFQALKLALSGQVLPGQPHLVNPKFCLAGYSETSFCQKGRITGTHSQASVTPGQTSHSVWPACGLQWLLLSWLWLALPHTLLALCTPLDPLTIDNTVLEPWLESNYC